MNSYKEQVVESAIQGLIEGGTPKYAAEALSKLFETIYISGYNEALRMRYSGIVDHIKSKSNAGYSDIISDGGMDPRQ